MLRFLPGINVAPMDHIHFLLYLIALWLGFVFQTLSIERGGTPTFSICERVVCPVCCGPVGHK